MAYGLSYPLLAHLVHSNIEHGHARGTEDARTGSWMGAVDERTRREKDGNGEMVQWAEVGQLLGGDEWWFAESPKCESSPGVCKERSGGMESGVMKG